MLISGYRLPEKSYSSSNSRKTSKAPLNGKGNLADALVKAVAQGQIALTPSSSSSSEASLSTEVDLETGYEDLFLLPKTRTQVLKTAEALASGVLASQNRLVFAGILLSETFSGLVRCNVTLMDSSCPTSTRAVPIPVTSNGVASVAGSCAALSTVTLPLVASDSWGACCPTDSTFVPPPMGIHQDTSCSMGTLQLVFASPPSQAALRDAHSLATQLGRTLRHVAKQALEDTLARTPSLKTALSIGSPRCVLPPAPSL